MVALIAFLVGFVVTGSGDDSPAEEVLFGHDRVVTVEIEIRSSGVSRLQAQPRQTVPGTVRVDARAFKDAVVRLKGNGSFQSVGDKPNFAVRLDQGSAGKRAFGHNRLLLNNSSQDPSFIRWKLASELFEKAGLPAAQVNFAQVKLNGRNLGLYVLVEPTDKQFLTRHFGSDTGNLYEGSNTDVEDKLELDSGDPGNEQRDLKALADACQETDLQKRWNGLKIVLDVDRFASFMALEVLICHQDGYSLDRNNFRIYHDPRSDRMVFVPHGMDLIFNHAELPLEGQHWRGTVARAFMDTGEGRRLYRERVTALGKMIYGADNLDKRISALSRFVREHAAQVGQAQAEWEASIAELQRIVRIRKQFVVGQASRLSGN